MKAAAARGTTAKHAGTAKTAGSRKHAPTRQPRHHQATAHKPATTAKAKHPTHAKARGAAATLDGTACCATEALAASLRLAGWPVGGDDVLALHEAAGGTRDAGVPILAALRAARAHGLAGVRPSSFAAVDIAGRIMYRAGQILGLELPGPHYVVQAGDGCWISWGEHYDPAEFPGAVVEECWEVAWPSPA